jgi:hypothetical protein
LHELYNGPGDLLLTKKDRFPANCRKPVPVKDLENLSQQEQANESPNRPQEPPEKETFPRHYPLSFNRFVSHTAPSSTIPWHRSTSVEVYNTRTGEPQQRAHLTKSNGLIQDTCIDF